MTKAITFKGWLTYRDTGQPYREWIIAGPVKIGDLEVCAGAHLADGGPDGWPSRFAIYGKRVGSGERQGWKISEKVARQLLGFPVPPWPVLPEVLTELNGSAALSRISELLSAATPTKQLEYDDGLPAWARSFPFTLAELTAMRDLGRDALFQYARPIRSDSNDLVMWETLRDRRRWAIRHGKVSAVLMTYRPVTRESITVVEASSDDAAIFELLAETGCRPGSVS